MGRLASMREYVEVLRALGDLNEVDREVDWNLELGMMASRCYETRSPAPLFTNVKDAAPGFSAISATFGESSLPGLPLARIALAVGLEPDATSRQIVDKLVAAREHGPVPPELVQTGPCKENILLRDDVDLTKLPMPIPHNGDGGRYLNTMGMIVCQTPDGSWTSWSVARVMLLDSHRGVGTVAPFQHLGKVHAEWRKIGKDMPFAIAMGVPPAAFYSAGAPLPERFNEVEFAGALAGAPIEVVKCETVDLEVPASSEIVIEGYLSVSELELEGPMGEMAGYLFPPFAMPQPVYKATAMTYRNNPIYPFAIAGPAPEEDHTVSGVMSAVEAAHLLRQKGIPVTTVWSPFETALSWMAVTVPDSWQDYNSDDRAFCREVAETILGSKCADIVRTVIVCNDDIDPSNLPELVWMLAGRHDQGEHGTERLDGKFIWPMYPYVDSDFGQYPNGGWKLDRAVWNCLPQKDFQRPVRTDFAFNCPADLKEKIVANWESDGFPRNPIRTGRSS